jgi:hypothetical protein
MPGWKITMTTDTEALVRRAYDVAEGDVLDAQGFIDLFAEDGVRRISDSENRRRT